MTAQIIPFGRRPAQVVSDDEAVADDERLTRLLLRRLSYKLGIGPEVDRDFGPLVPEARDARLLARAGVGGGLS